LRAKEEWIPITVPAVISVADFMAVQEKLARNSEFSKRNAKYPYLLKSLVFCSCGKRRYGDPCHGKPRYKCSDKSHNYPLPKVCQEGSVDASVLDKAIWDAFFAALDRPEILASKVRSLEGEEKRIAQVREVEEKRVGRELASLDSQEQRLLKAYAEQAITVSQLKRLNNEINGKREKILNQSSKSSQTPSKKEGFEVSHGAVLKIFAAMREKALRAGDELKQRILQLFVDQVIVGGGTAVIRAYLPAISENDSIESITSACCARLPLRS
jgi:site-specific DNA recombinase